MKLIILTTLVAAAAAGAIGNVGGYGGAAGFPHGGVDYYAKPDYNYAYSVKDRYSGVNTDAHENRYGHQTEGSYGSNLPDGRRQEVKYWVNGNSGFNADVQYYGVAVHPKTPIYRQGFGLGNVGYGKGYGGGYNAIGHGYNPYGYGH
ncbi:adult-specific cuticular protein ACP-20-like [Pollicipes pollicipes]|uniref:adult-specific cuticular protein ACP-20-like n=1 Tax=Pollicipes pollicipes TaxID=41117 RepID=UPI001885A3A5|nr:adult-specific cuticular protein ACP-20-like [Pollicipes pollicipes]